jgi:serine/threonine-protein kinase
MEQGEDPTRCPSCGSVVAAANRFCGACGAHLGTLHPGATRTSASPAAAATPPFERAPGRFLPGTVIAGRYRVFGLLGRGGMGEVYRADDLKLGQAVALKFLPEPVERDPAHLARLLAEVRVARQVSHPNVCRVYDVVEVGERHFLSIEYVDGEDLASLLRRIGRLPEDKAVEMARQLCAGLAAAHAQGIVHRDLKPSNVMIDGRGLVRITDFGLAALAEAVRGGAVREGTPLYMAPEQLEGRQVSVQSDLYSLGLVLYELFTGKHAFSGPGGGSLERDSAPTRPSAHVDGLDPAVERILLHCLETDRAERPGSALAVAAALPGGDPLAAALAAGETPSPEMVAAAGEAQAIRPPAALVKALLAVALFAAGAWLNGRDTLRAWVLLDKPPEVMVDRAREVIRQLGYTEPAYADPADSAFGYDAWLPQLDWIEAHHAGPDPWARLRSPDSGVVSFWYRQSPVVMWPEPTGETFASGRVGRWNPFPETTGSTLVSLDPSGRLRFFVCTPRRYSNEPPPEHWGDASEPFALAGLDLEAFRPIEPRYQRFMLPDRRAAWLGALPERPDQEVRIEAGWSEGRLVLFAIVEPWELDYLAAQPGSLERVPWQERAFLVTEIGVLLAGAGFARHNVRRGRADRRGATRIASVMFAATLTFEALRSHALLHEPEELFPIAGTALLYAAIAMMLYLALEPWARRAWPSILVSWSRLVGRARPGLRDPLVGRSVLAGLLAGAAVPLLWPLERLALSAAAGSPARPAVGDWTILLGQRHALAEILHAAVYGVLQGFVLAFVLVAGRLLLRSKWQAFAASVVLWVILGGRDPEVGLPYLVLSISFLLLVLLRHGLVALVVARAAVNVAGLARAADWSAWHAQGSLLAVAAFAALAGYGYWAAVAGRRWSGAAAAAVATPPR